MIDLIDGECVHGHLKRKCELCQRDDEIAELEEEVDRLRKYEDAIDEALVTREIWTPKLMADPKAAIEAISLWDSYFELSVKKTV